ncbi:MAG: ACT domain-containing protein, partial [Helicobacter apodemus]|nr:ACT domain-containing protein [Helicobacter apodemus]
PFFFVQVNANSFEKLDYRHYARKFKELPNELFDDNLVEISFSIITFAYKGEHSPIFKAFYLDGLDDLNESGILYKVLKPLKENNISVLVISALNRDYIFIHKRDFNKAIKLMGMK